MRRRVFNLVLPLAAFLLLGLTGAQNAVFADEGTGSVGKGVVNINAASAEELARLPGIGEKIASRILEFREKHGEFEAVEDLLNVKGIGEKSFEKMRKYLVTKGETTLSQPVKSSESVAR
jgi:competence protein ComEA